MKKRKRKVRMNSIEYRGVKFSHLDDTGRKKLTFIGSKTIITITLGAYEMMLLARGLTDAVNEYRHNARRSTTNANNISTAMGREE